MMRLAGAIALFVPTVMAAAADEAGLNLVLPTDNQGLLRGDNAGFYQVVERNVHGVVSYPWQGGQYGFVRDPLQIGGETIYTRFHEGMDIRPMRRDSAGEPLDEVRAIADGTVVYTSSAAGASNYGRYVVIEHEWGGCPYYSLYGHLSTIAVAVGQHVEAGRKLAVMGHTGEGISRERAHVHVELNLFLNDHFQAWHESYFKNEVNRHGVYNGLNLVGIDLPKLFLALERHPSLTIPTFLSSEETFYKVLVPNSPNFQLPRRYPWMVTSGPNDATKSWEISFAQSGVPLHLTPSNRAITQAELSWLKLNPIDARYLTRSWVSGRGADAHLTDIGRAMMRLLTFPD